MVPSQQREEIAAALAEKQADELQERDTSREDLSLEVDCAIVRSCIIYSTQPQLIRVRGLYITIYVMMYGYFWPYTS